jgi:hypothetical protein
MRVVGWFRAVRYVVPWVTGLFFFAQVSGIIPRHYDHAGRAGHIHALTHVHGYGSGGTHHYAILDSNDECCAVHGMSGIIPAILDTASIGIAKARVIALPEDTAIHALR